MEDMEYDLERIANALDRIASALERAYPDPNPPVKLPPSEPTRPLKRRVEQYR